MYFFLCKTGDFITEKLYFYMFHYFRTFTKTGELHGNRG